MVGHVPNAPGQPPKRAYNQPPRGICSHTECEERKGNGRRHGSVTGRQSPFPLRSLRLDGSACNLSLFPVLFFPVHVFPFMRECFPTYAHKLENICWQIGKHVRANWKISAHKPGSMCLEEIRKGHGRHWQHAGCFYPELMLWDKKRRCHGVTSLLVACFSPLVPCRYLKNGSSNSS